MTYPTITAVIKRIVPNCDDFIRYPSVFVNVQVFGIVNQSYKNLPEIEELIRICFCR